jgi:phthalate 4,5-cis-dihydrodiol dehydrogenase
MGWAGELGNKKDPDAYWQTRDLLYKKTKELSESNLKASKNFGGTNYTPWSSQQTKSFKHQHFGTIIASCDKADLRPMPDGIQIYGNKQRSKTIIEPPAIPRAEVIDELYNAIYLNEKQIHEGAWALANLEICIAILTSAQSQKEVLLEYQCSSPTAQNDR